MDSKGTLPQIDELIARLRQVGWKEREAVKDQLLKAATASGDRAAVREYLQASRGELSLELRWEIDEVLEALAPPKPPEEPEPEPEEPEDDGRLSASDLNMVYDDPRGLMLHKTKQGDRWFATQRDPRTGQPQTFELHPQEVQQLKAQLAGSPYWVLGSGEAPRAKK